MKKVIYDRPANSRAYDEALRALCHMTGRRWGYVSGRSRIQYITGEIPVKIGLHMRGRRDYFNKIKNRPDIIIRNITYSDDWASILAAELRHALLTLLSRDSLKFTLAETEQIIRRIQSYCPNLEYVIQCDEARSTAADAALIEDPKKYICAWERGTEFVDFPDYTPAEVEYIGDW